MFGIYLTHPQVRIDPDVPVPRWGLSGIGSARAEKAASCGWARELRRILSSDETKALETAAILAQASDCDVEVLEHSGENDRSATGFLVPEEFEKAANRFFAHPRESFHGWERAIDAQRRIVSAVSCVLDRHDPLQPIAFVGHGGVGTLLKCHLAGLPIARSHDQPAGGGNLFAFSLADRSLACDWTGMELWQGWQQ
ncbi:MAG TPA: histidine phosphatase family protein [Pararhizobium sp.]|uniref:histidine phosphatase family protein n=1 Tax=Pararhizobium sp. TaxID=1977563 RepID=UPI002BE214F9|nr:histidine phosphatase family protein [Pararhizobium sp.]HTO31144.1 histidine phosphatase family protein [Pararhizobium sp.]